MKAKAESAQFVLFCTVNDLIYKHNWVRFHSNGLFISLFSLSNNLPPLYRDRVEYLNIVILCQMKPIWYLLAQLSKGCLGSQ